MKPPNPFVQLFSLVATVAVFVVSVLIGGIVLAALVGFILLMMLVVYLRVWWVRRKFQAAARTAERGDFVEVEYRVVDVSRKDEER